MAGTFVSVGNGTQDFVRLLDEVKQIASQLPQPVLLQYGRSTYNTDANQTNWGLIEAFDFTDEAGFKAKLQECELFITHGGGGSVFTAIRMGKTTVVVPRRLCFNEIVDDHQMAFTKELANQGKITPVYDVRDLALGVQTALAAPPPVADVADMADAIHIIRGAVEKYACDTSDPVLLVTPSGGHLTEMRNLRPCYDGRPHHFVINVPIVQDDSMIGRTTIIATSQRDWKFILNLFEAWQIMRTQKPKVILTTGGGFSVAFALVGKLLRIPTVYVETVAKVTVPTATGKAMYWLTKDFFYQWPYLRTHFPKGREIGLIL